MTLNLVDLAAVEKKFWEEIERCRLGMITVAGARDRHLRPMTAFTEPESHSFWFYTRADSDLAREAGSGAPATFVAVSKDRELQTSVVGELSTRLDVIHRDKFWNPIVAAWFAGGRDDPALAMLQFKCDEAEIWVSDKGRLRLGWEILKANIIGTDPDIGGHVTLKFS